MSICIRVNWSSGNFSFHLFSSSHHHDWRLLVQIPLDFDLTKERVEGMRLTLATSTPVWYFDCRMIPRLHRVSLLLSAFYLIKFLVCYPVSSTLSLNTDNLNIIFPLTKEILFLIYILQSDVVKHPWNWILIMKQGTKFSFQQHRVVSQVNW